MQKRLEELHQQLMVSCQEPQQDGSSTPASPTILGIPHELRSNILELALYHDATDGLIAPLADGRSKNRMVMVRVARDASPDADIVSVGSAQHGTTTYCPNFPRGSFIINDNNHPVEGHYLRYMKTPHGLREAHRDAKQQDYLLSTSPNVTSEQFCSMDCLVQPPATKVNRQLRLEALHTFYTINRFHFELSNFDILASPRSKGHRLPPDWWRSIGDTNLRLIRPLSFAAFLFSARYSEREAVFAFHQRQQKLTKASVLTVDKTLLKYQEEGDQQEDESYWDKAAPPVARDPRATLREYVGVIEKDRLHVRVLEQILAPLGPGRSGMRYLRDRSALEKHNDSVVV